MERRQDTFYISGAKQRQSHRRCAMPREWEVTGPEEQKAVADQTPQVSPSLSLGQTGFRGGAAWMLSWGLPKGVEVTPSEKLGMRSWRGKSGTIIRGQTETQCWKYTRKNILKPTKAVHKGKAAIQHLVRTCFFPTSALQELWELASSQDGMERELKEINNHVHPTAGNWAPVGSELGRKRKA